MKICNIASPMACSKIFYKAGENQSQESNLRFQISTLYSSMLLGSLIKRQLIITCDPGDQAYLQTSTPLLKQFPHCLTIVKIAAY